LDFYSIHKINIFSDWFEQIKNEMKNQIQENFDKLEYPQTNLDEWINNIYI